MPPPPIPLPLLFRCPSLFLSCLSPCSRLVHRHPTPSKTMARDMKVNYNQLTLGQLRRMCDTLLSLGDDQRVVAVPERALKETAGSQKAPPAVAMEVGGGSYDDGVVAQEEEVKEKKKKKKGKGNKKKKESSE